MLAGGGRPAKLGARIPLLLQQAMMHQTLDPIFTGPTSPGAARGFPGAPLSRALVILALALALALAAACRVLLAAACAAEVRVAVPRGAAALRACALQAHRGQALQGRGGPEP
jgi:hypothetical protein